MTVQSDDGPNFASFADPKFSSLAWLSESLHALKASLSTYRLNSVVAQIAGLMLLAKLHPNTTRLEALLHLAVLHCAGDRAPSRNQLNRWLNVDLGSSALAAMEDPVEDVFVGNLCDTHGNYLVLEGIWESASYYTQQVLDLIETLPRSAQCEQLKVEIRALLKVSNAASERAALVRNIKSGGHPKEQIPLPNEGQLRRLREYVAFSPNDLAQLDIQVSDIEPFLLRDDDVRALSTEYIGNSALERRPLMMSADTVIFALPSAVTNAIRTHVLETFSKWDSLQDFEKNLTRSEIAKVLHEYLPRLKIKEAPPELKTPPLKGGKFTSCAAFFDTGKPLHLIIIHDDLRECAAEGLLSLPSSSTELQDELDKHITAVATELSTVPDYSGGLTLVVFGGIGRGFAFGSTLKKAKWHVTGLSIADLATLSWDADASLIRVWKILDQQDALAEQGIDIFNINGLLNLYGYVKQSSFHLCPPEYAFGSAKGGISLATDYITSVRHELKIGFDEHSVPFTNGEFIRVRRESATAFFKEVERLPAYVSYDKLKRGRQIFGVVETARRPWWVSIDSEGYEGEYRELAYRIWDATFKWMTRAAPIAEQNIDRLPAGPIHVRLSFENASGWPPLIEVLKIGPSETSGLNGRCTQSTIEVEIGFDFLRALHVPQNLAERALISEILTRAAELAAARLDVEAVLNEILLGTDRRFLHLFEARTFAERAATFTRHSKRFIQQEDEAFARLGLAWTVKAPSTATLITGQPECLTFLNALPDRIWERMRARLSELRLETIARICLANLFALQIDQTQWARTARANLAIHEDKSDVIESAWKRDGLRNASSLAARLVLEMATCTSSTDGGRSASQSDYDFLAANALLIAHLGQNSDAIKSGYMPDRIQILPSGDLRIETEFYDQIVRPRAQHFFRSGFKAAAASYETRYAPQKVETSPRELGEPELKEAFLAEYGVELEEFVGFAAAVQDEALKRRTSLFEIKKMDLIRLLCADYSFSESDVIQILNTFALPRRSNWDETKPDGFRASDWYPWKFRRRLSLLARPIVVIRQAPNEQYLLSPELIDSSFRYLFSGIYEGSFPDGFFTSEKMRKWDGYAKEKKGREFNVEVAERFSLGGCKTCTEVDVTSISGRKSDALLGDIDVLAWSQKTNKIYVVEAKNLFFSKTVGEMVEQLQRYRGVMNERGEPDDLARHIRRVKWCNENRDAVRKYLGLVSPEKSVVDLLVFSNAVPMKFYDNLGVDRRRVIEIQELEAALSR